MAHCQATSCGGEIRKASRRQSATGCATRVATLRSACCESRRGGAVTCSIKGRSIGLLGSTCKGVWTEAGNCGARSAASCGWRPSIFPSSPGSLGSARVLTIAHNAVAASNRARTEALRQRGLSVELLTPQWWLEEGRRIDVSRSATWRVGRTLFTGNGTRHVYLSGLAQAIRDCKPDVIDLYEEPFSLVALQTLLLRDWLAPGAAFIFYSAVNVARSWRQPYAAVERLVLRRADGAHAPSREVPPILRARGMTRQPVSVIPLGVDVQRFATAEPMALPDVPSPRVGFIGRFEPVKGLDILLEAHRQLQTPASLVLVGDGSE